MDPQKISQSKTLKTVIYCLAVIILIILVFQAGVFVGYRKAAFSYRWGDNYYRTFGDQRRGPMMGGILFDGLTGAHGVTGQIIKIDLPTFIIEGQDKVEKLVVINNDTVINRFRESIKPGDLKTGDFVVVIGSPNDKGQIEARLIRLAPPPPDFLNSTSTNPQ